MTLGRSTPRALFVAAFFLAASGAAITIPAKKRPRSHAKSPGFFGDEPAMRKSSAVVFFVITFPYAQDPPNSYLGLPPQSVKCVAHVYHTRL